MAGLVREEDDMFATAKLRLPDDDATLVAELPPVDPDHKLFGALSLERTKNSYLDASVNTRQAIRARRKRGCSLDYALDDDGATSSEGLEFEGALLGARRPDIA